MARRKASTNAEGLERTLKALADRLEPEDEALIALARSLAAAVDADPCTECRAVQNAALWAQYHKVVSALILVGADGGVDDDTQQFLLTVRTPGVRAAVGNAKDS